MKVYLLLLNSSQSFFYSDATRIDDTREGDEGLSRPGLLGWLSRRWQAYQSGFYQADGGLALKARRAWDWLHSLTRPDEAMLVRLRSAHRIELHHPASRDQEEVQRIWMDYLAGRWRSHSIRLFYNAVLSVPAVAILWALPGPNVIGFWFAYRSIHHWRVLNGIRAVRNGRIPTIYFPEPTLDVPVERDSDGKARHQAIQEPEHHLDQHLSRLRSTGASGLLISAIRYGVPNLLSFLRIVLALAFPCLSAAWRGGIVIAAALSDLFDGRLSRALGGTSTLGQILDPVADKLFVGIVLVTLVLEGKLTIAELCLVGFRDLAVLAGLAWSLVRHGWSSIRNMPPSWLGKLATAGQFAFLLLLTMNRQEATLLNRPVELVAVTLSVLAGLDYLRRRNTSKADHATPQL